MKKVLFNPALCCTGAQGCPEQGRECLAQNSQHNGTPHSALHQASAHLQLLSTCSLRNLSNCFVFLLVSFFTWMCVTAVLKELPCSKTWIYYWIYYSINKRVFKNISSSHLISVWSFQIKMFSNTVISYIIRSLFWTKVELMCFRGLRNFCQFSSFWYIHNCFYYSSSSLSNLLHKLSVLPYYDFKFKLP